MPLTLDKPFHLFTSVNHFFNKVFSMVRPPCCERMNARKGNWNKEEDVKVLAYVPKQRTSNWTDASKKTGNFRLLGFCLFPDVKNESTFTSFIWTIMLEQNDYLFFVIGPKKCGKSCKHKCSNHLRPDKKHETFTPQEEELIINLHAAIGSRWVLLHKSRKACSVL